MPAEEVVDVARDVDVLTETVIRRPVGEVAAFAGDPGNAPEWYVNIASVEWRTPPPLGVGSCMDFVARFLGRRRAGKQADVQYARPSGNSDSRRFHELLPSRSNSEDTRIDFVELAGNPARGE